MNTDRVKQIVRKVILKADATPKSKKELFENTTSETLINYASLYIDGVVSKLKKDKRVKLPQEAKNELEIAFHQTLYLGMLIYRIERTFAGVEIPRPQSTIEYRNHVILGLANEFMTIPSFTVEAQGAVNIISESLYARLRADANLDNFVAEFKGSVKIKLTEVLQAIVRAYYIQDTFRSIKV